MPESIQEFATRIKSKYPQYSSVPDAELVQKVIEKYPQYRTQVDLAATGEVQPSEPTAMTSQILGGLNRAGAVAGSGLNQGMMDATASLLGMPVDAVTWLMNKLGAGIEKPVAGSESIRSGLQKVMPSPVQPEGTAEEWLSSAGQLAGASAPVLATMGMAGAAGAGASLAQRSSTISKIAADAINSFSRLSLPQIARIESAVAASGATGGQLAKEVFPDNQTAEMVGQLTGIFGLAGVGSLLNSGKNAIRSRFAVSEQLAKEKAGGLLRPHQQGISNALRVQEQGIDLPLGTGSGDPTLRGVQQDLARQSPITQQLFDAKTIAANRTLKRNIENSMAISSPENAQATATALQARINAVNASMESKLARSEREFNELLSASRGVLTDEQRNAILRQRAVELKDSLDTKSKILYAAVDPENKVQLSARPIVESAQSILDEIYPATHPRNVPSVLRKIKSGYMDTGTSIDELGESVSAAEIRGLLDASGKPIATQKPRVISFNELSDLRSRVLQDIRDLRGSQNPNVGQPIRRLEELRRTIEGTIDSLATDPAIAAANPGVIERYRQASSFYKQKMDMIGRGAVREVLQPGLYGNQYKMVASEVAGNFLKSGKGAREAAQDFKRAFGGDAEATQVLYEHAISDMAENAFVFDMSAGKSVFSPAKARAWIGARSDALGKFPELQRKLLNLSDTKRSVDRINQQVIRTKDVIERSAASLWLGEDSTTAMQRVLSSSEPNRKFSQVYRMVLRAPTKELRQEGFQGLRRSFFEEALKHSKGALTDQAIDVTPVLNADKFEDFLYKYPQIVRRLWTPKHLDNLKEIVKPIRAMMTPSISRGDTAMLKAVSQTSTGNPIRLAVLHAFGFMTPQFAAADLTVRTGAGWIKNMSSSNMRKILNEAFYDPKVAQELVNIYKTKAGAAASKHNAKVLLRLVGGLEESTED